MRTVLRLWVGLVASGFVCGAAAPSLAASACVENPSCEQHFPDSGSVRISPFDLAGVSRQTLWEARNEIFARKGYRFRTGRAQSHFGSKAYYRPCCSDVTLNSVENANVALIKAFENGDGDRLLRRAQRSRPAQETLPNVPRMVVAGLDPSGDGFLSIRSGPGTNFARTGRLLEGAIVASERRSGDWVRVRTPQGVGWAHGAWLSPVPARSEPGKIASSRDVPSTADEPSSALRVVEASVASPELSAEDRKAIGDAQEAATDLQSQIEALTLLLDEQKAQTDDVSVDSATVQETVVALASRIEQLEGERENAAAVLRRYDTPVRPQNANLETGSRRASEAFPKIPYFQPGLRVEGEMWVEPVVTDTGVLTFDFKFIDPQSEYEVVASAVTMSLEELRETEEALRTIQRWNRTAREQRVRKRFDKEAACFPLDQCADRVAGNASTSIVFQIDDDGSTETQIVRNKGAYQERYGYSMESALLLISYLQHVEKEGRFDYDAGTQTRDDLDALFD